MEHFTKKYTKFFPRKQLPKNNFDKYYLELRELVKTYGFGNIEDNLL